MSRQRSQYEQKKELAAERRALREDLWRFLRERRRWEDRLSGADPDAVREAVDRIVKWPSGHDPLVYIDALAEAIVSKREDTLTWKGKLLNAAILVDIGAIACTAEDLKSVDDFARAVTSPVPVLAVDWLLQVCDVSTLYGSRGQKTAERILAEWNEHRGLPIPTKTALIKRLTRAADKREGQRALEELTKSMKGGRKKPD